MPKGKGYVKSMAKVTHRPTSTRVLKVGKPTSKKPPVRKGY